MIKQKVKGIIKYLAVLFLCIFSVVYIIPIVSAFAKNSAVTYTVTYGNGQTAKINPGSIVSINAKETNTDGQYLQRWLIKDSSGNDIDVVSGKFIASSGADAVAYLYFEMPDMDVVVTPEYGNYSAGPQTITTGGMYAICSESDVNDIVMSYTASLTDTFVPPASTCHSMRYSVTNAGDEHTVNFVEDDFSTSYNSRISLVGGSQSKSSATLRTGQMVVIDEPYIQDDASGTPSFFNDYTIYGSDKATVITPTTVTKKIIDTSDGKTVLVRTSFVMPGEDIYVVKNEPKTGYKLSLKNDGSMSDYLSMNSGNEGVYYPAGEEVTVTLYNATTKTPYYIYTTDGSNNPVDITLNRTIPNVAKFTMPNHDLTIYLKKISTVDKVNINSKGVINMTGKKNGSEIPYELLIDTDDIYFNRLMIEKMEKATGGVYISVDAENNIHMYQKDANGEIINDCLVGKYTP